MESDDDFELFSPPEEAGAPSPQSRGRKLKRLKRAAEVIPTSSLVEALRSGFAAPEALGSADPGPAKSAESGGEEFEEPVDAPLQSGGENGIGGDDDDDADSGYGDVGSEEENEFPQVPGSDPVGEGIGVPEESGEDPVFGESEERWQDSERDDPSDATEKKRRKKNKQRRDDDVDGDSDHDKAPPVVNKRREEKERRDRLKQLQADSQRVLRETRDASFKPIPMVQKPISSVLEKIRQRKLEISKKMISLKSANLASRYLDVSDEEDTDFDLEDSVSRKGWNGKSPESMAADMVAEPSEMRSIPDVGPTDGPNHIEDDPSPESSTPQKSLHEESKPAFRPPVDDTQELFPEYQNDETKEDPLTDSPSSPMEEAFAPSLLAMKLKFDSAPLTSDDEEDYDNDKENIAPHLEQEVDLSPPLKDPVRDFLDEEAEEEDDSDGDPFKDDEDEDIEDAEELNDMIATNYIEKPIDKDMRNELHQKWLEQQDAAGMDTLLHRIKGGLQQREATLLDEEDEEEQVEEEDEDDEELGEAESLAPKTLAQMNLRKARQMISEMFTEKDDPYISSEDEESDRILTKQSLSEKIEGKSRLLSPSEDETSREVFSRIKKLNIMPENKRRSKPSALNDLSLASGKTTAFLKPSFLGRSSSSSLPSKNQKTSTIRSFIFGRDDSNSRSAISAPEESTDTIQVDKNIRPTRTPSAKFSSSQTKAYTQTPQVSAEADSRTSLFDILRRPSAKPDNCVQDAVDTRTQSIYAAFRIGKRPREGRVMI